MEAIVKDLNEFFINGEFLNSSGGVSEVFNPATEEPIGLAPVADSDDASAAIHSARSAFDHGTWSKLDVSERARYLQRFHDAMVGLRSKFVEIIRIEGGATCSDAGMRQFDLPLKHFQACIKKGQTDFSRNLPPVISGNPELKFLGSGVVKRIPAGVVLAISAFNYPTYLNLAKIGPALITGNTVVLKPSPLTPFQALLLGQAAKIAELPPGVLNIINGDAELGLQLTTNPDVDLISFTGSDVVGAKIAQQASVSLKRVLLELGGKSAVIVRADGDLDMAAQAILKGFTSHCGQGCAIFTRALVHNSIRKELVERVATIAKEIKVGDPADPKTTMGPLISASQRSRTEKYVGLATDSDAKLIFGGSRPNEFRKGYFYLPTLFDEVSNSDTIAQEEIFGPVGCIIGFDSDEEAINLANDSKYGLRAGIITKNVGLAYELAEHLKVGHVVINGGSLTSMSELPFGGIKRSGYGREGGEEGLLEYTYSRAIEFHAG